MQSENRSWEISARHVLALTLLAAGCVSTTLEAPIGHPARPDAPAARPGEVATSLRPGETPPVARPQPPPAMHHHDGHGERAPAASPGTEAAPPAREADPPPERPAGHGAHGGSGD